MEYMLDLQRLGLMGRPLCKAPREREPASMTGRRDRGASGVRFRSGRESSVRSGRFQEPLLAGVSSLPASPFDEAAGLQVDAIDPDLSSIGMIRSRGLRP